MPRSPTVYNLPPGTSVSPNATIESSWANTLTADIAQTFNTPQPIAYGGTGATSKQAAVDALFDGTTEIADENLRIVDPADDTKVLVFDVSGITTATTRTITVPDQDITLGTVLNATQATTSGTTTDFTSIPDGVRAIHLHLSGISFNASADLIIQIGDSGGVETSGYDGSYSYVASATASSGAVTSGFCGMPLAASEVIYGTVTLRKRDSSSTVWLASSVLSRGGATIQFAGAKALTGTLDRVRITSVAGTATLDAGAASVSWEY